MSLALGAVGEHESERESVSQLSGALQLSPPCAVACQTATRQHRPRLSPPSCHLRAPQSRKRISALFINYTRKCWNSAGGEDKLAPMVNLLKVSVPQMAQLQPLFLHQADLFSWKHSAQRVDIICQYYLCLRCREAKWFSLHGSSLYLTARVYCLCENKTHKVRHRSAFT